MVKPWPISNLKVSEFTQFAFFKQHTPLNKLPYNVCLRNQYMLDVDKMFGHHMVLQRQKVVKIWGTGIPGRFVSVRATKCPANNRKEFLVDIETQVNNAGIWLAELTPQEATYDVAMSVSDGESMITFNNVAFGDVWIAAGQSNMKYQVHFDANSEQILYGLMNHRIRYFCYPQISIPEMEDKFDFSEFARWRCSTPEDLPYFSSVAYYFATDVSLSLDIPIGIIGCYWGGTPACAWMDVEYLENTEGKVWLDEYQKKAQNLNLEIDKQHYLNHPTTDTTHPLKSVKGLQGKLMYPGLTRKEQSEFQTISQRNNINKLPVSGGPHHHCRPGGLYSMMVKKIAPYTVQGVIWYQGESDYQHTSVYHVVFSQLIYCWRNLWREQLPFLFVQLAPFEKWLDLDGLEFPLLRERQKYVAELIPNVWMVSSSDAGMKYDIHPKAKKSIGQRLALLALNKVYHKGLLADAPYVSNITRKDNFLYIKFAHGEGLHIKGKKLNAMSVVGLDGKAISIKAVSIEKDTIVLQGDFDQPLYVHFANTPYYNVNLYNSSKLPALPFEVNVNI